MHSLSPVSNKILHRKWEEKERLIHYQKLRDVKPTLVITPTCKLPRRSPKKELLIEGKL